MKRLQACQCQFLVPSASAEAPWVPLQYDRTRAPSFCSLILEKPPPPSSSAARSDCQLRFQPTCNPCLVSSIFGEAEEKEAKVEAHTEDEAKEAAKYSDEKAHQQRSITHLSGFLGADHRDLVPRGQCPEDEPCAGAPSRYVLCFLPAADGHMRNGPRVCMCV